jgi:hypothetical protein
LAREAIAGHISPPGECSIRVASATLIIPTLLREVSILQMCIFGEIVHYTKVLPPISSRPSAVNGAEAHTFSR